MVSHQLCKESVTASCQHPEETCGSDPFMPSTASRAPILQHQRVARACGPMPAVSKPDTSPHCSYLVVEKRSPPAGKAPSPKTGVKDKPDELVSWCACFSPGEEQEDYGCSLQPRCLAWRLLKLGQENPPKTVLYAEQHLRDCQK